jgi:hypothetical protein
MGSCASCDRRQPIFVVSDGGLWVLNALHSSGADGFGKGPSCTELSGCLKMVEAKNREEGGRSGP